MRLTYSHVYPYENKYNPIGENALNNLKKKIILQFSMRLLVYQKVLILFSQYSHKNIEIKERPPKYLLLLTSTHRK